MTRILTERDNNILFIKDKYLNYHNIDYGISLIKLNKKCFDENDGSKILKLNEIFKEYTLFSTEFDNKNINFLTSILYQDSFANSLYCNNLRLQMKFSKSEKKYGNL